MGENQCGGNGISPLVKRGTENQLRDVNINLIRNLYGVPLLKIGIEFNLKKHSSVSSVIERTQNRLDMDRQYRKRVEKLKGMLIKGQTVTPFQRGMVPVLKRKWA